MDPGQKAELTMSDNRFIYRIDRSNPNTSTRFVKRESALRAMTTFKWGDCLTVSKSGKEVEIYGGFKFGVSIKINGVSGDDITPDAALDAAEAMLP